LNNSVFYRDVIIGLKRYSFLYYQVINQACFQEITLLQFAQLFAALISHLLNPPPLRHLELQDLFLSLESDLELKLNLLKSQHDLELQVEYEIH
jgi:hypothetical protein